MATLKAYEVHYYYLNDKTKMMFVEAHSKSEIENTSTYNIQKIILRTDMTPDQCPMEIVFGDSIIEKDK